MTSTGPARVTVVTAPDCHLCADAQAALASLARDHPLTVDVVTADSEPGQALVRAHGTGMFPLVLLDRAFFTVECINLLKEMGVDFITPCVCNERVRRAVNELGKEGRLPFSIRDSHQVEEASFTMVVSWSERQKKLIPFATNVEERDAKRLVKKIPKEYKRRWGIETSFRKVKEVYGMTTSPSPAIRMAYFMTAMILYNVWQAINLTLSAQSRHGAPETTKENGYRVTMPLMVTIACAHLSGRI